MNQSTFIVYKDLLDMKATIITIGTEILIGQIIDTNSAYLGEKLGDVGIEIASRISISDDRLAIITAIDRAMEDADLIVITGGLGPTRDDITKKVLAEYLGTEMYFDDKQYEKILQFFKQINRPTTPAHKEQCYFPKGVEMLANNMGTAPGMLFHYKEKRIISMPGVPYEMKHIMEENVLPMLIKEQKVHIVHKTIQTAGCGETVLAELIEDIELSLPEDISIAYLPSLGKVRVRISMKGKDLELIHKKVDELHREIKNRFGKYVFGEHEESLAEKIGELLSSKKMTVGIAESCTGGAIASLVTRISGCSSYFEGGVVSYSNALKQSLLGVSPKTLEKHGAVSEETVKEMVKGAIILLGVDVAISISGIAGPTGGTKEKPVGTVWLCVGNEKEQFSKKLQLTKNRIKNIEYSANAALNLLRLYLTDNLS